MCGALICNYSPLCTTNVDMHKTQCIKVCPKKSMKEFEARSSYAQFWVWYSLTQEKKLKKFSNENLKDLNNVLFQCNFNFAKQVTREKTTWTFGGQCSS
jgi:5-methylcytosine-specific restriction endonuclease McrA